MSFLFISLVSSFFLSWVVALVLGFGVGQVLVYWSKRKEWKRVKEESSSILKLARREAEVLRQEALNKTGIAVMQKEAKFEREKNRTELEIEAKLWEIRSHEESIGALDHELNLREETLNRQSAAVTQGREAVRKMSRDIRQTMANLASMDVEEIKKNLYENVQQECREEHRKLRKELLDRSDRDIAEEARRLLVSSMQRLSTRAGHDLTSSILQLPNEDMKGRIIGREGRNIKCFEAATGTTLLIDESPQVVLISSFDPVRRAVAKAALERLIEDGRIHPATIEDFVKEAKEEIDSIVIKAGEEAIEKLKISTMAPEIIELIGQLQYRFSYTQNMLDHSIEVATLCSILASEVGLDPSIAKRAGLLHDIGKSMDGEYEGTHALIGAEFVRQRGEDAIVVNAIAAHHEEVKPESVYAGLVILADTISAVRPGARAEPMTTYVERLGQLEQLATSFEGVLDAYAIQAGREVRVVVHPAQVTDDEARELSRKIRNRIEEELQYPGSIKITVIREQRFTEKAK
ncbi:MAG: ribonuclease Y [Opitutaceae bacterium]|nr:ribonuclease Y [Opitutaceae bacterium]